MGEEEVRKGHKKGGGRRHFLPLFSLLEEKPIKTNGLNNLSLSLEEANKRRLAFGRI